MLRALIFLTFLIFSPLVAAENCEVLREKTKSCAISVEDDTQSLCDTSFQKADEVLRDKSFQDFVVEAGIRNRVPEVRDLSDSRSLTPVSCYVFVSFSLGEKALLNLAVDAKKWGATLVLRGFKEGSYTKTAKALQKIIQKTGQGVIIDPELFTLFAVTAVPTFVLSKPVPLLSTERVQTPHHDRLQGHVSLQYALEAFAKEGDLSREAKALLQKGLVR